MEGHLVNLDTSIRAFKTLFDGRLTAARASKLDNLNASMTSRAAQTTVNDIRTRVIDSQTKVNRIYPQTDKITGLVTTANAIKSKTDKIARVPTSGVSRLLVMSGASNDYIYTVTGAGIIRVLSMSPSQAYSKIFKLNVDGKWVVTVPSSNHALSWKGINFAAGGIRFNSYFKIYQYGSYPARNDLLVSHTTGD